MSASKALPKLFQPQEPEKAQYEAVPLEDLGHALERLEPTKLNTRRDVKVRISVLAAAIVALSLRIELYRRIAKATECTIDNVEVFLPFLLACYDAARSQRPLALEQDDRPDSSIYDGIRMALSRFILRPRTRYLLPMFLVSYGTYLAQGLWSSSNSTYICPIVTGEPRTVPAMQVIALFLDLGLVLLAYESSPKSNGRGLSGRRYAVLWSSAMIATAVVWLIVAAIVYMFKPEYRNWLLLLRPPVEFGTFLAMLGHVLLFCLFCISTLHCVSQSHHLHSFCPLTLTDHELWRLGHVALFDGSNDTDTRIRVYLVSPKPLPANPPVYNHLFLSLRVLGLASVST